jgi:hypothetical protein
MAEFHTREEAAPLTQERGLLDGGPTPVVLLGLLLLGCRLLGRESELSHH